MNSRRRMLPPSSGDSIVSAQTITLIGAETGIKTIAAVHRQCRLWVKSRQTVPGQNPRLSAVTPIADKMLRCRECPLCADFVVKVPNRGVTIFPPEDETSRDRRLI